jgi:orotidine-5'-phosphate decarboxylase
MKAARDAAQSLINPMKLLAITQLTSTSQQVMNEEIGIPGSVEECVIHYAKQAYQSGVDGIVCSGHEVSIVKEITLPPFLAVVPGIRFTNISTDDQKRIVTPTEAIRRGADYLVIGRPITGAASPLETYNNISREINQVMEEIA